MRAGLLFILPMFVLLTIAGVGPSLAAQGDLVFPRQGDVEGSESFPPSIFPHWVHRIRYRCYVCHPAPFAMQLGENPITMEKINNGEYCGACHNGKIAFNVEFTSCARCHREPSE